MLSINDKKFNSINGQTINLIEKIDAKKLKWCIDNIKKLKINTKRKNKDGEKQDPMPLLKKYFLKVNNNTVHVRYNQKEYEKGRYYAYHSLSLQNIVREVRHTISKDNYWDVDVANAHPSFVVWYCTKHNINCDEVKNYVNNRQTYFNELKETFKDDKEFDAKSFMLKLLNGGGKSSTILLCPKKVIDFYNNITFIHDEVCKIETQTYEYVKNKYKKNKKKNHNIKGKTTNHVLCDIENQVLFHIVNFLNYNKVNVDVLVFDGCMVDKSIDYDVLKNLLLKCEEYIFNEMNLNIKLTIKEMNEGFNIPAEELINIDMTLRETIEELVLKCINGSHKDVCLLLHRVYGENIKIINREDFTFYHWNEKSLLWEKETKSSFIRFFKNIEMYFEDYERDLTKKMFKLNDDDDDEDDEDDDDEKNNNNKKYYKKEINKVKKILNNLSNTPFLLCCIKYYSSFDIDKNFELVINNNKDYIPIKNGYVINLKTKHVRLRDKADYYSFELDVEYKYNEDKNNKAYKFLSEITLNNKELTDYLIRFMGYCLSGYIDDRSFHIMWGTGANGKSTIIEIMKNILKNYYASLSDQALMKNDKNTARATPELMPLLNARICVLNETDEERELNASRIKSLTGGDIITARALFCDEINFKTQAKIIMLTNAKPIYNTEDKAMNDRIKMIPFLATFEKNKNNNDYIEDLKTNYLDAFFYIFVDGCYRYLNGQELIPCTLMLDEMNKYKDELDKTKDFINNYDIVDKNEYDKGLIDIKITLCIKKTELLSQYLDWCSASNEKPIKRNDFFKMIEKKTYLTNKNGKCPAISEAFLLKKKV